MEDDIEAILYYFLENQNTETSIYVGPVLMEDDSPLELMLKELTPFELMVVKEAIESGEHRPADLAHDIKGISEKDKWFLPRVIRGNK